MKRKSEEIETPFNININNNNEASLNSQIIADIKTEEEYYSIIYGKDYKNNKDYLTMIKFI